MNSRIPTATLMVVGRPAAYSQQAAPAPASSSTGTHPAQFRLDTQRLTSAWRPVLAPATGYGASQPPDPVVCRSTSGFGAASVAERQPGMPVMYIIPIDAYQQLWNEAGNSAEANRRPAGAL
jgi:hypothetical protein